MTELLPNDLSDLKAHEYADMFPMIADAERGPFRQNIAENGLTDEIVLWGGLILDGRNRYRELKVLGWETQPHYYVTWEELVREKGLADDPFAYVIAKNLHRRHLTDGQRAMAAVESTRKRPGQRNDIHPQGGLDNTEPSANLRQVTPAQAAELFQVSDRTLSSAFRVAETGVPELQELVRSAKLPVSVAEEIARMPEADQQRAVADHKPAELKNVAKKYERQRKAKGLADKQMALPIKRFGVIYCDNEWEFVTRSENGLDRAPGYPVSSLEELMARRVGDIAADDCVLFMWATVPMLIEAFMVAHAWGFCEFSLDPDTGHYAIDKRHSRYVSNWDWVKDKIITGYWGRGRHEHLLIFTRGKPVAPAPGTQPVSVIDGPDFTDAAVANAKPWKEGEHSAKPDLFAEWIERLFPDAPKIELNARQARPGWDVWGNEAPEPRTEIKPTKAGKLPPNLTLAEVFSALPPPAKSTPAEVAKRRNDRMTEKSKRDGAERIATLETRLRSVGRDLPDDDAGLVAEYRKAIDAMDAAMIAGNKKGVLAARDRQRSIVFKVNDWKHFGSGANDRANKIVAEADARKPNDRLKFGQCGAIRIAIDDPSIRAIAKFDHWSDDGLTVSVGVHATTLRDEFPSETGYRSIMGVKCLGLMSIADAGIAALHAAIAESTDKKRNQWTKGMTLPETSYDIAGDGSVTVKDRRPKEETPEPSQAPAGKGKTKTGAKKGK